MTDIGLVLRKLQRLQEYVALVRQRRPAKPETLETDLEPKVDLYSEKIPIVEFQQPLYLFMVIPLAITAAFSIIYCLFPNTFGIYALVRMAVANTFGGI